MTSKTRFLNRAGTHSYLLVIHLYMFKLIVSELFVDLLSLGSGWFGVGALQNIKIKNVPVN